MALRLPVLQRRSDEDCGECGTCDYCARMTPALMALADVPCTDQELDAPDQVVASALTMFLAAKREPPSRSS